MECNGLKFTNLMLFALRAWKEFTSTQNPTFSRYRPTLYLLNMVAIGELNLHTNLHKHWHTHSTRIQQKAKQLHKERDITDKQTDRNVMRPIKTAAL